MKQVLITFGSDEDGMEDDMLCEQVEEVLEDQFHIESIKPYAPKPNAYHPDSRP